MALYAAGDKTTDLPSSQDLLPPEKPPSQNIPASEIYRSLAAQTTPNLQVSKIYPSPYQKSKLYSGAMRSLKERSSRASPYQDREPHNNSHLKIKFNHSHKGDMSPNLDLSLFRTQCAYCYELFKSRNALFLHLQVKGVINIRHNQPKSRIQKRHSERRRKDRRQMERLTNYLERLRLEHAKAQNHSIETDETTEMFVDSNPQSRLLQN